MIRPARLGRFDRDRPADGVRIGPLLGAARSAAPLATPIAFLADFLLVVAAVAAAPAKLGLTIVLCGAVSMTILAAALALRSDRAFLVSALALGAALALGDLPVHRGDAAVLAAVGGAGLLVFLEAGGVALESTPGKRLGRPGLRHAGWVVLVAGISAAAGWLLLSLQPDLSDLGLAALVVGVLAGVLLVALFAVLADALTRERET
jgi:hypothetical protein